MKKIEKEMLQALNAGREFAKSNTQVIRGANGGLFVKLYDTLIYAVFGSQEFFCDGGYKTVTTGSRLRALGAAYSTNENKHACSLTSSQKMFNLYWNGLQ